MQAKPNIISGDDLRRRIRRLGITYARAADCLGLTLGGLNKQMNGDNPVSRQTTLLLEYVERHPPPRRVIVRVTTHKISLRNPADRPRRAAKAGR
jgi:hypothetical protein